MSRGDAGTDGNRRLERCGLCGRLTRSPLLVGGRSICRRCERRLVTLFPGDLGYERLQRQVKRLLYQ
ncbi:MAG: sigma factor G inhibitor Gin [Bacillota bacterium]